MMSHLPSQRASVQCMKKKKKKKAQQPNQPEKAVPLLLCTPAQGRPGGYNNMCVVIICMGLGCHDGWPTHNHPWWDGNIIHPWTVHNINRCRLANLPGPCMPLLVIIAYCNQSSEGLAFALARQALPCLALPWPA